jgi:hypothetical protein
MNYNIKIESLDKARVIGFLDFEDIGPPKWFSEFFEVDACGAKFVHVINSSWKNAFGLYKPLKVFQAIFINERDRKFCFLRARVFGQDFIFFKRVGGF